jgi:hypothetical protein
MAGEFSVRLYEDALKRSSETRIYYGAPNVLPSLYFFNKGGKVVVADDCQVLASFNSPDELENWIDKLPPPTGTQPDWYEAPEE